MGADTDVRPLCVYCTKYDGLLRVKGAGRRSRG